MLVAMLLCWLLYADSYVGCYILVIMLVAMLEGKLSALHVATITHDPWCWVAVWNISNQ